MPQFCVYPGNLTLSMKMGVLTWAYILTQSNAFMVKFLTLVKSIGKGEIVYMSTMTTIHPTYKDRHTHHASRTRVFLMKIFY